jgi:predicted transcriptional regulator
MNVKSRSIEVDAQTADLLEARARARGMSVAEFLADVACNQEALPAELAQLRTDGAGPWSPQALDDDARRLAEFERSRLGVPWQDVKAWLESWGTPNQRPTPKPRRL